MQTDETKQKISISFWESPRPGKSRIPPKIVAYIKYLYINKSNYVMHQDLAHALRVNPETIRLLLIGTTWQSINPQPPSDEFESWITRLHSVTRSLEFHSASATERLQMIREQTERELVNLLQSV
ncbi:MAG: hypothetical protein DDT33_00578 [Firmicutes bacterium]|nr:hypothetical protein [Bacillota bacterium]